MWVLLHTMDTRLTGHIGAVDKSVKLLDAIGSAKYQGAL